MGFYRRTVFPWLNDRLNRDPEILRLRRETLAPARGRVLEIGFGTGSNLPHYPQTVTEVVGIEPSEGMTARAKAAVAQSRTPVEIIATNAESLPVDDRSVDTAVSTLTLCTVADPQRVLSEIRRVLRTDGVLIVLEHGLSADPKLARWQHRLNGIQKVVACGCNLDRDITALLKRSGFGRQEDIRQFFAPKMPRTHGWITAGVVRPDVT
jgi:ubiquinone/menaquinone biosynthesis C-methylase UbiE